MKATPTALGILFVLALSTGNAGAAQLPNIGTTDGLCITIHPDQSITTADLDMIKAAGFKYIREDCWWSHVEETKGQYSWGSPTQVGSYDWLYNQCQSRGLRVEFALEYGNGLYGNDPTTQEWLQGYKNYAAATVTHYAGSNNIYAIWQEPDNGAAYWLNRPASPSEYMNMLKLASPAMRAADPNCTILAPDVGWINTASDGFMAGCFNRGLLGNDPNTGKPYIDAVSVHPYRQQAGAPLQLIPETVAVTNPSDPLYPYSYAKARNLMTLYGGGSKPLVAPEWGYSCSPGLGDWSAGSLQGQADCMARTFLINMSQGIRFSGWYEWKQGYDAYFGVVEVNLSPTPSYYAMQELTSSLRGTTFTERLASDSEDWLLAFTSPNGERTLAAWTTGEAHTITDAEWGELELSSTPFYVNPVPEPNTLLLLAIAGLGLLGYRWIRGKYAL